MSTTLTNGLKLPDKGSVDWYADMQNNYTILDGAIGTVAEHTSALAGKAPLVHTHVKADITDFPAYGNEAGTICEGNDSRLSDARTPVAHTHTKSDVTDLLNSNFIPSANNSYDLGSSSYQWNNLYAKGYYYNGVAWGLDQENVWSGSNRFTKSISLGSITSYKDCSLGFTGLYNTLFFNTRGSSNITSYGTYVCYGYSNASSDRGGVIIMVRTTDKRGDTNDGYIPDLSFNLYKISPAKLFIDFMEAVKVTNNGTENSLKPITNNTTDLGTSDNKWKSLNGVNPGGLSLPQLDYTNTNRYIDISGSLTTTGLDNWYTPAVDGWVFIIVSNSPTFANILVFVTPSGVAPAKFIAGSGGVLESSSNAMWCGCPAPAGSRVRIRIKNGTIEQAVFVTCQGNV